MTKISDFFRSIAGSFYQFQARDVIDIAIVALAIYHLIMLTKGTRAVQVLKGLAGILFGYLLALALDLSAVTWFLDKILTYGTLVIVVIFQPEIRSALERFGRSNPLFGGGGDAGKQVSDLSIAQQIANAMDNMARRKVGALIVVERVTKLRDIIETGSQLNAMVTEELIIQVFEPNTLLHDGAMVIQGNMIAAAGCILPLTKEKDVDKELGTRHRAALGISEVSDAIAFVVSEETGNVSVASSGELRRYLKIEDVVEILAMGKVTAKKGLFSRIFGKKDK